MGETLFIQHPSFSARAILNRGRLCLAHRERAVLVAAGAVPSLGRTTVKVGPERGVLEVDAAAELGLLARVAHPNLNNKNINWRDSRMVPNSFFPGKGALTTN